MQIEMASINGCYSSVKISFKKIQICPCLLKHDWKLSSGKDNWCSFILLTVYRFSYIA